VVFRGWRRLGGQQRHGTGLTRPARHSIRSTCQLIGRMRTAQGAADTGPSLASGPEATPLVWELAGRKGTRWALLDSGRPGHAAVGNEKVL